MDCGKSFIQLSNLNQHLKTHTSSRGSSSGDGNSNLVCTLCARIFKSESSLVTHKCKGRRSLCNTSDQNNGTSSSHGNSSGSSGQILLSNHNTVNTINSSNCIIIPQPSKSSLSGLINSSSSHPTIHGSLHHPQDPHVTHHNNNNNHNNNNHHHVNQKNNNNNDGHNHFESNGASDGHSSADRELDKS